MNRHLATVCVLFLALATTASAMLVEPHLNEPFSSATFPSEYRVPAALDSSFGEGFQSCRNNPINEVDPLGLGNQPGDYGWKIYSVPVDQVLPVVNAAQAVPSYAPRATVVAFDSLERLGPQTLDRPEADSEEQAQLLLAHLAEICDVSEDVSVAAAVFTGKNSEQYFAALQIMLAIEAEATLTSLDEYERYSQQVSFGGPSGDEPIRSAGKLTENSRNARDAARFWEFQAQHPVMGLQSPEIDPIDVVAGGLAMKAAGMVRLTAGMATEAPEAGATEMAPTLPKAGEDLFVGSYGESRAGNLRTGLAATHTPHHVVQGAVSMTSRYTGVTINLRKHLHGLTRTYGKLADLGSNIKSNGSVTWW